MNVFAKLSAGIALTALTSFPVNASDFKVFAAASLTDVMQEALKACTPEGGMPAQAVYAGSGTLARQIAQGAAAGLFIPANPQWMDWLGHRGLIAADTRSDLLGNRLVLAYPKDAGQKPDLPRAGSPLPEGLRIGIGEVNSVPAGIYGKQALQALNWWNGTKDTLVQASNVREILTWLIRNETDFGILYRTDALNHRAVEIAYEFPQDTHNPIRYPIAVIADFDSPEIRRLAACLQGRKATAVFTRYGFWVPVKNKNSD